MNVELSVADLLTVAGCGAATLLILQFIVKPLLNAVGGNPSFEKWRPFILNCVALVVSVGLAFLAQAVTGITYESGLQAFLTGLVGAVTAIGGYEGLKNAVRAFGS